MKIKKHKKNQRIEMLKEFRKSQKSKCLNCGETGSHYVGPSMGDSVFFICESEK